MTGLVVPLAVTALGVAALTVRHGRRRRARQRAAVEASLGFTVDLVSVVLGAGGTVRHAVATVAEAGPAPVRPTFAAVASASAHGHPLADALAEAAFDLGPAYHPLLGALLNTELDGAPVGPVLTRLTDDLEQRDRWRSEAAAGRLPVLLLPPLVVCLLPAVVIGAVVPLAVVALRDLRW